MDELRMINKLKKAGVHIDPGMTAGELDRAEAVFGLRFPKEIRAFLSCGVPVGKDFFDYRDVSPENEKRFLRFQESIERSFRFDLEYNRADMLEILGNSLGFSQASPDFDGAVLDYLRRSVKLIPFFAHRCFFDGMDGLPIVSFWQPTDSLFYGDDFEDYLESEFLGKRQTRRPLPGNFPRETGIWYPILMCE